MKDKGDEEQRKLNWHRIPYSSNIYALAYDKEAKELYVAFSTGGQGKYSEVPDEKFREMLAAQSKGGYLNAHIKPHHKWQKIEEVDILARRTATAVEEVINEALKQAARPNSPIGPVQKALRVTKQALEGSYSRLKMENRNVTLHLWAACGKPAPVAKDAARKTAGQQLLSDCFALIDEAGGSQYKHLAKAIELAAKKGV